MILVDQDKWKLKAERLAKWRPWFAWHPVKVRPSGNVVWWEQVERRTTFVNAYDGTYSFTDYRIAGDTWGNE